MRMVGRALLAAGGLVTLAACGGGGSSDQQSAQTNTSEPAAATPATTAASPTTAAAPAPDDVTTKTGVTLAQFTPNAAAGEQVFVQCRTCHVTDPGQNRIGPTLHQVVGRQAGSIAGYNYSNPHKNSGITWTKEKLFQYLEDPRRVIPGNKMVFAGISDPQQRADLIAWLETQGGTAGAATP
jgi:cytochrome c